MTYEELLHSVTQALPETEGKIAIERVRYVKSENKAFFSFLSDVKSNSHAHHPLFRRCMSNRLRVCCSLPTLMDQGIFIVRKTPKFVNTRFVSLS